MAKAIIQSRCIFKILTGKPEGKRDLGIETIGSISYGFSYLAS